jgi:hypothetical protein
MRQHLETLQQYSDIITKYIQNSLFNPENMEYLKASDAESETTMTLPITIFDDNPNVNSVIVAYRVNDDSYGEIEAYYKCVVDDRSKSDLIIIVDVPREYDERFREYIDGELADALGHELQHSCESPEIMNVKIPEGIEKWESVENVWAHFGSDVETKGYVVGFFLRSLTLAKQGREVDPYDIMDQYVMNQIYQRGVQQGLNEQELQPIIKKVYDKWSTFLENVISEYYD